ncbi:9625_t:CDS:2 [Racocetra fulgida]|uniref:9625_t:CDS:1 n=1 Tax=Racocetra fulgida TaxID=60492 RepID=A0A9N8W5C3_9GLOM|nr:9625_t:CDS:2 [Racocetra fulgida]
MLMTNKEVEPSNLERLSLEVLRVVCKGMGVSDFEPKKEVMARLARESRAQLGLLRAGDRPQQLRAAVKNSYNTFGRQSVLGLDLAQTVFKRASKTLLDKALVSVDIAFVHLARQIILERAYVVRVVDEDVFYEAQKDEIIVSASVGVVPDTGSVFYMSSILMMQFEKIEVKWPKDSLPVAVIERYIDCPPPGVSMMLWAWDLALVALSLKVMRRLDELCNLKRSDVTEKDGKLWIRVAKSKTDQLGRGKFITVETKYITKEATIPV